MHVHVGVFVCVCVCMWVCLCVCVNTAVAVAVAVCLMPLPRKCSALNVVVKSFLGNKQLVAYSKRQYHPIQILDVAADACCGQALT